MKVGSHSRWLYTDQVSTDTVDDGLEYLVALEVINGLVKYDATNTVIIRDKYLINMLCWEAFLNGWNYKRLLWRQMTVIKELVCLKIVVHKAVFGKREDVV